MRFGEPFGSEPAYRRPAVIIQDDKYNDSAMRTTIVIPLTTNLRLADFPRNYYLPAEMSALKKDSVVVIPQITVIDKLRLIEKVSALPNDILFEIADNIKLVLKL